MAYVFGRSIAARRAVGPDVAELAAMRPTREVGDDVELLSCLEERLLQSQVVARRHDELVGGSGRSQQRRQAREEAMDRRRDDLEPEQLVQLVVERPRSLHRRHVLRDPR